MSWDELARLGSATVHEAAARSQVVDLDLVQVIPGSRAAGPARTVRCGQDDNLMVHAAIAEAEPGEVLVVTMPEPNSVSTPPGCENDPSIANGVVRTAVLLDDGSTCVLEKPIVANASAFSEFTSL